MLVVYKGVRELEHSQRMKTGKEKQTTITATDTRTQRTGTREVDTIPTRTKEGKIASQNEAMADPYQSLICCSLSSVVGVF